MPEPVGPTDVGRPRPAPVAEAGSHLFLAILHPKDNQPNQYDQSQNLPPTDVTAKKSEQSVLRSHIGFLLLKASADKTVDKRVVYQNITARVKKKIPVIT